MATFEVDHSALLDAARVLYASARPSWFDTRASPQVGPKVSAACDGFVARRVKASVTKELLALARALELASGTYLYTEDSVAARAGDHGH